jgi:hypothetical protein
MFIVRVGSLTGDVFGKVPGELAIAANNECDVLPLYAMRLHFSVHRVAGVPSAQVLGVLFPLCFTRASCPLRDWGFTTCFSSTH